jgi:hypothetical protein
MQCPLCRRRHARRQCPAKGCEICAVCCGTKRTVEIQCPEDCGYLAVAQVHPPATVRRRQERDLGLVMAIREGLSEAQADVCWAMLSVVAGFRADPLLKLSDDDLAAAAAAVAATFETADRGVIYEHRPDTLVAERLATEFKALLGQLAANAEAGAARTLERDAAVALRHLERGARGARRLADEGPTTAVDMIGRVVRAVGPPAGSPAAPGGGPPAASPGGPAGASQPLLIRP